MLHKITNSEKSLLHSLKVKKYRYETKLFLIEGLKPVKEALFSKFPLKSIYISNKLDEKIKSGVMNISKEIVQEILIVSHRDIESITALKSPEGVIGVGKIIDLDTTTDFFKYLPALYLFEVNDPGNLGTILRTSLWFGIKTLFLSPNSVDLYSPKVVRSSMGAIFRMKVYTNIKFETLVNYKRNNEISFIAFDAKSGKVFRAINTKKWIGIFGNESHGLPDSILSRSNLIMQIPKKGYGDSLNLSVAVGVALYELCVNLP